MCPGKYIYLSSIPIIFSLVMLIYYWMDLISSANCNLCSYLESLNPLGMNRDHLCYRGRDYVDFGLFTAILGPLWPNLPLKLPLDPKTCQSWFSALYVCLKSFISIGNEQGSIKWPRTGFWQFRPIFGNFGSKFGLFLSKNGRKRSESCI